MRESLGVEEPDYIFELHTERVVRQAVKEHLTVALLRDSVVQQCEHSPVGASANQAPKPLFQRDCGLRNLVIVERIPSRFTHVTNAGFNYWIVRYCER